MTKKPIFPIISLILCCIALTFAGCISRQSPDNWVTPPPELRVTSRTSVIMSQYLRYDMENQSGESEITVLSQDRDPAEYLQYVALGETVYLELSGARPDPIKAYIVDEVYSKGAAPKYSVPGIEIPVEFIDCKASFTLKENFAALLSSNSYDYIPGGTIRGFTLHVEWPGESCDYFFALRSDASWSQYFDQRLNEMIGTQQKKEELPETDNEVPKEWIRPEETADVRGMNVYWNTEAFNFPMDSGAQLIIYNDAELYSDGSFGFDDGNQWAVVLKSTAGIYSLIPRRYVQLGNVTVAAYWDYNKNDENFHILITVFTTASYTITDFIFNEAENAFYAETVYSVSNINLNGASR